MSDLTSIAKLEATRLEKLLKRINDFECTAPEGCLKWQKKNGKPYYYQQILREDGEIKDNNGEDVGTENEIGELPDKKKWKRNYIKKRDISLAKSLAQKHYYALIKPILEQNLGVLEQFIEGYQQEKVGEIYDDLSVERKNLVMPMQISEKERIIKWNDEVYEQNTMYPENLRYETEQGEMVRSKSEVIIANILYQHRNDILYKYERPLQVMEHGKVKIIYPDFTIMNIQTGKVTYWEHAGLMDNPYYANEFMKKVNTYCANDLLPGRDVVLSFESGENPLDIGMVKKLAEMLI